MGLPTALRYSVPAQFGILMVMMLMGYQLVRLEDKKLIASYQKRFVCGSLAGYLHFYTDEKSEILPETVIVHTAFGMIRAEKHKRDTVWEILGEIAENAGG